jgi:cytochrome b6-f complex iron-sulfur subunit
MTVLERKTNDGERRQFLKKLWVVFLALAGCFATFIGVGFLYPIGRRKPPPLFVCLESQVPLGKPLEIKDPEGRNVLLLREKRGKIIALGSICPHLGCTVYYRPQKKVFECPCHQGVFDADGNPTAGPPVSPLNKYETEVRGGKVFVQFA